MRQRLTDVHTQSLSHRGECPFEPLDEIVGLLFRKRKRRKKAQDVRRGAARKAVLVIYKVPAERLIAAVPLYTRVWRTNDGVTTSEAMGIRESEQYVSDNAIMLSWDEEAGAYYGETMIGTGQIQIWLEENESLKLKTDKIREYGLTGIAAWRLGFEPQDVWDVLDLNRE